MLPYSAEAIDAALHRSHVQVFEALVALPLKNQTEDLLSFPDVADLTPGHNA